MPPPPSPSVGRVVFTCVPRRSECLAWGKEAKPDAGLRLVRSPPGPAAVVHNPSSACLAWQAGRPLCCMPSSLATATTAPFLRLTPQPTPNTNPAVPSYPCDRFHVNCVKLVTNCEYRNLHWVSICCEFKSIIELLVKI